MDSPTDFSNFMLRTFTVDDGQKRSGPPPTFRIALTHDGTEAEADAFAKDVERIVREAIPIFGELPKFETNTYTFLSVYLPWANGDGMEHRNSTSLTSSGALRNPQQRHGHPRHRRARVLPRLEHGAPAFGRRRAVRFRRSRHERRPVARRRLHQLFRRPDPASRRLHRPRRLRRRARRRHQRRHAQSRPHVPQRRRHEPAGAVRRCGGVDRSHRVAEPVHLLLHLRPGDRPRPRSVAARSIERQGHRRRLHEGVVGAVRPPGPEGARQGQHARTRSTG